MMAKTDWVNESNQMMYKLFNKYIHEIFAGFHNCRSRVFFLYFNVGKKSIYFINILSRIFFLFGMLLSSNTFSCDMLIKYNT